MLQHRAIIYWLLEAFQLMNTTYDTHKMCYMQTTRQDSKLRCCYSSIFSTIRRYIFELTLINMFV